MRVLVTRPSEDSKRVIQALKRQGHAGVAAPLLGVKYTPGPELDFTGVQALLFTSANGVRAFCARSDERHLTALCVGDATGREALDVGFETVKSAGGDVEALAALVKDALDPAQGALLHPAGSKVAGDLKSLVENAGFAYRREVLYEAIKATQLPSAALEALRQNDIDGVLLFSPRTGAAFTRLVDKAGVREKLASVTAYCLSAAVAGEIGNLPWKDVCIAQTPDQTALLALLDA